MTTKSKPFSYRHRIDRERAERLKTQLLATRREIAELKHQLGDGEQFAAGSAATLGMVLHGVGDDIRILNWICDRASGRKPTPIPQDVLDQFLTDLRASGIKEISLENIEV